MTQTLWIVLGIVAFLLLWIVTIYNRLVTLKNRTDEAWSDINVQLKRRYDLIPNLIEAVKGYAKHERKLFIDVTAARTAAINAKSVESKAKTENMLSETLKSIFAVAENYPQLRASENFKALQDELSDTENKIEASRRFYNTNARDLNTRIEQWPDNMFANMLGFTKRPFFELDEAEPHKAKNAPKVSFEE